MTTESQPAWLIHKRWSGDTSAWVFLFTPEHGLLNCSYKGCRTPKKQAALMPFAPLWLTYDKRRDYHYVRSLEINATPLHLTGQALFSALYVNELIYYVCRVNDPQIEVYEAYKEVLNALSSAKSQPDIEMALRRFECLLLKYSGYEIPFFHDLENAPIQDDKYYHFMSGEGFNTTAQGGIKGEYLIAIANNQIEDPKILRAAKIIMRQAINHLLEGRVIKARELFKSGRAYAKHQD